MTRAIGGRVTYWLHPELTIQGRPPPPASPGPGTTGTSGGLAPVLTTRPGRRHRHLSLCTAWARLCRVWSLLSLLLGTEVRGQLS